MGLVGGTVLMPATAIPSLLNSSCAPSVTAFDQSELVWNSNAAE
jgi:hypothetical protein